MPLSSVIPSLLAETLKREKCQFSSPFNQTPFYLSQRSLILADGSEIYFLTFSSGPELT